MTDKKQDFYDSNLENDRIDIYGNPDVHVRKLESDPKIPQELQVEISGKNIDNSVVNAIRRTILMSIPIYGFHRSNIHIDTEKSIHMYNSDMIYNQLETLPIFDVSNLFDLENPELYLPTDILKNLFGSYLRIGGTAQTNREKTFSLEGTDTTKSPIITDAKKHLSRIELVINYKNNTDKDHFLSTHDAIIRVDGKVSDSYTKRDPICILVLKPDEEISLRAEANLGIAHIHAIYEATTNAVAKEITLSKYVIIYETLEQLDKHVIFTKACLILERKLQHLKKYIQDQYTDKDVALPENDEMIELRLIGEDYTIGYLLATALQKCSLIEKAGYAQVHPFNREVIIHYKLFPKTKQTPIQVLLDTLSYLITLYNKILAVGFKSK